MRWERAKNLMILFFAALNLFLGFFLYQESRRYSLSPEQERAIFSMLSQNSVTGSYIHLIRQFPPMRPLMVTGFDYDMDTLLSMFFLNEPEYIWDPRRDIYRDTDGDITLIISNGYISYENPHGLGIRPEVLTRDNAALLADLYVSRHYPNYVQDLVVPVPEGFRFYYRESYRGYIVHSNFIMLLVTEYGITQVDMQYGRVVEFFGPAREICSPDEALLTFIQRIRSIWPELPVMIDRMDLVYYQPEIRARENAALHATPYYRIFIKDTDTLVNEMPFLINAYTNVCIN
jgi:hypothetical protein